MTSTQEIPFPTFARIYPEQQYQLAAWSQQFQITEKEIYTLLKIAGPVEKDVYDYLQKLRPAPVRSSVTYEQLLSRFQAFVDTSIRNYFEDYKRSLAMEEEDVFHGHCWDLLLNEIVEEAGHLINDYADCFDKEKLLQDFKQISAVSLLVPERKSA